MRILVFLRKYFKPVGSLRDLSITAKMIKTKFKGIYIFGILLILSSLDQMMMLIFKARWYWGYYHYYPIWFLTIRYIFSWLQRILGLSCGVGILFGKDIFRKIAIAIGIFTICFGYWKHPVDGFVNHIHELERMGILFKGIRPGNESDIYLLARISAFASWFADTVFWGWFIFYFTRKKVKDQFTS